MGTIISQNMDQHGIDLHNCGRGCAVVQCSAKMANPALSRIGPKTLFKSIPTETGEDVIKPEKMLESHLNV